MDIIELIGLEFFGYHGATDEERIQGQVFIIDVYIYLDVKGISKNDNLDKTVDYSDIYSMIRTINKKKKFFLIETLAEFIAESILEKYKKAEEVLVRVKKKNPPIYGKYNYFGVVIKRGRE